MEFARGAVVSSLPGRDERAGKADYSETGEAMTQHRTASSAPSASFLTEENLRVASVAI